MTKTFLQKKYGLLLFVLVACFTQIQAQDYVFFEDFSGGIPEDFVIYDLDENTVNPNYEYVTQAWTPINFTNVIGAPLIVSTSSYSPAGQADDWIGTPGIDIDGEGYTLSWKVGTNALDGYEIYVSTVNNELESLQEGEIIYSVEDETILDFAGDVVLFDREVDLSAYAGETIFIAFRNNSYDEGLLIVDDIAVTAPPEGIDAIITSVRPGIEYAETPLSYVKPVGPFGAEVLNFSDASISNVTLTVYVDSIDVDGNVINVWSASSEPITAIELSESQEIIIDETYLPTDMGFYAVSYEVTHDGSATEVNLDNNASEFYTFSISDANYERDAYFLEVEDLEIYYYPFDDIEAGEVEQTGSFGTVYEFNNGFTEIDSVGIFVYQPIGPITCDIFEFNTTTNQVGALVASTEVWEGSSPPGEAVYQTLALTAPLTLGEGAYFVAANDPADGNLNMIFLSYYQTPNRSFIKEGAGGNWSALSDVPSINLIVTPSDIASFVTVDYDAEGLTYNFVGNANGFIDTWTWDFGDGNTAMGQEVSYTFTEGTYEVCVTGSLPDGSSLTECTTIEVSCALEVVVNTSSTEASLVITEGIEPFTITWADDTGATFLTDETTATDLMEGIEYTVTVEDGNGCMNTQMFSTVSCNLEIGEPEINPASGAISFAESTISGEPILYNWPEDFSADPTNAVVFDVESGNYMMTIEDANGCSVEVNFVMPEYNSIEDLGFVQSFSLAPNPANSKVTLNVDFNTTTTVSYEIYTIAGQRLMEKTIGQTNKVVETIDISTLSNGIYFVQLNMNDQVHIEKLVVNK